MKVAVTWEMCGYVDIEADTMEEAMKIFNEKSDKISLPDYADMVYVDGSFRLSSDDVEEMKAMSEWQEEIYESIFSMHIGR